MNSSSHDDIGFQGGTVKTVTVTSKTVFGSVSEDDDLRDEMNKDKETFVVRLNNIPVPGDGLLYLKKPVKVNQLQVRFDSPVSASISNYKIILKIFACIEPIGKFFA